MQICKHVSICNAHPHDGHFRSCFGTCNAVNRISRWICNATSLANLHYNTACNLSCVPPKTSRFVLQNPHLDSVVGTFFLRIPGARIQALAARQSYGQPELHVRRGAAKFAARRRLQGGTCAVSVLREHAERTENLPGARTPTPHYLRRGAEIIPKPKTPRRADDQVSSSKCSCGLAATGSTAEKQKFLWCDSDGGTGTISRGEI